MRNTSRLEECSSIFDEVCFGGPKVWTELDKLDIKCPKPCNITEYYGIMDAAKYNFDPNEVKVELTPNREAATRENIVELCGTTYMVNYAGKSGN